MPTIAFLFPSLSCCCFLPEPRNSSADMQYCSFVKPSHFENWTLPPICICSSSHCSFLTLSDTLTITEAIRNTQDVGLLARLGFFKPQKRAMLLRLPPPGPQHHPPLRITTKAVSRSRHLCTRLGCNTLLTIYIPWRILTNSYILILTFGAQVRNNTNLLSTLLNKFASHHTALLYPPVGIQQVNSLLY